MTEWQEQCMREATAAGRVTPAVFAAVRKWVNADGDVYWGEAEFLVQLRHAAPHSDAAFHHFVFHVVQRAVLRDGGIGPEETAWLRQTVFTDGRLDEHERRFLDTLRESAVTSCPEFDRLVSEHVSL